MTGEPDGNMQLAQAKKTFEELNDTAANTSPPTPSRCWRR